MANIGGIFGKVGKTVGSIFSKVFGKPVPKEAPEVSSPQSKPKSDGGFSKVLPPPTAQHAPKEEAPAPPPSTPSGSSQEPQEPSDSFINKGEEYGGFKSSNVSSSIYDKEQKYLQIGFKSGGWYGYHDVEPGEAGAFHNAGSKGKWIWDNLRVRGTVFGYRKPYAFIGGKSAGKYQPKYYGDNKHREEHRRIGPAGHTPLTWQVGEGPYHPDYGIPKVGAETHPMGKLSASQGKDVRRRKVPLASVYKPQKTAGSVLPPLPPGGIGGFAKVHPKTAGQGKTSGIRHFAEGGEVGELPKLGEHLQWNREEGNNYRPPPHISPEHASYIPKDYQKIGKGSEAEVFGKGDFPVYRVGLSIDNERPNISSVLQPLARKHVGNELIEKLPYAPSYQDLENSGKTLPDWRTIQKDLEERLAKQGYEHEDLEESNVGFHNGEWGVIDPGGLRKFQQDSQKTSGMALGGEKGNTAIKATAGEAIVKPDGGMTEVQAKYAPNGTDEEPVSKEDAPAGSFVVNKEQAQKPQNKAAISAIAQQGGAGKPENKTALDAINKGHGAGHYAQGGEISKHPDQKKLFQSAEKHELEAVNTYQNKSHYRIQNYVRAQKNGRLAKLWGSLTAPSETKKMVSGMDSLIAKGQLPEMTVYRGGRLEGAGENNKDIKSLVGKTITEWGYASTSTSPEVAESFMRSPDRAFQKIHVPEGTPGLSLSEKNTGWGAFDDEQEILLPRGTSFRIDGVKKNPRWWEADLEVQKKACGGVVAPHYSQGGITPGLPSILSSIKGMHPKSKIIGAKETGTQYEAEIQAYGKALSLTHDPDENDIYAEFTQMKKQAVSPKAENEAFKYAAPSLQSGSISFFHMLKDLGRVVGKSNMSLSFGADERRNRLYKKIMESVGLENIGTEGENKWGAIQPGGQKACGGVVSPHYAQGGELPQEQNRFSGKEDYGNYLPKGSPFLARGMEALVYKHPKENSVYRVETALAYDRGTGAENRPAINSVLQALGTKKTNSAFIEKLPYAPSYDDLKSQNQNLPPWQTVHDTLENQLAQEGYFHQDLRPSNVGLHNGQWVVIDPGGLKKTTHPQGHYFQGGITGDRPPATAGEQGGLPAGGIIGPAFGVGEDEDEVDIKAKKGEGILNKRAMQDPKKRAVFEQLNKGGDGSSGPKIAGGTQHFASGGEIGAMDVAHHASNIASNPMSAGTFGTAVGSVIGGILGGPAGAIIGATIGNVVGGFIDKSFDKIKQAVMKPESAIAGTAAPYQQQVANYSPGSVERFNLALDNLSAAGGRVFEPIITAGTLFANELNVLYTTYGGTLREFINVITVPGVEFGRALADVVVPALAQFSSVVRPLVQQLTPLGRAFGMLFEVVPNVISGFFNIVDQSGHYEGFLGNLVSATQEAIASIITISQLFEESSKVIGGALKYIKGSLTGNMTMMRSGSSIMDTSSAAMNNYITLHQRNLTRLRAPSTARRGPMTMAAQPARHVGIEEIGLEARRRAFSIGEGDIPQQQLVAMNNINLQLGPNGAIARALMHLNNQVGAPPFVMT